MIRSVVPSWGVRRCGQPTRLRVIVLQAALAFAWTVALTTKQHPVFIG
jgi:hypothetical protein